MKENKIQNFALPASNIRDYSKEIAEIIRSNLSPKILCEKIIDYHEKDIAAALTELNAEERKKLYSLLESEMLSSVIEYAENPPIYINELSIKRKVALLSFLEPSSAVEYLSSLEKDDRQNLLDLTKDEAKKEIALLSSFDSDEIGSRMTTNYIEITLGSQIKEAMNALISQAADKDNISTLYVVDRNGLFCGAVDLKDLITARKETPLDNITVTSYPYVYATEQIEECIERIKNYSEDSIPVLDGENRLIGVLISQEVIELIDEELGEDYAKLAGLSSEESLNEPMKKSIGKRLPWLSILLFLGLLVSGVVGMFERVVSHLTLIVCFQSLILGMAGNTGTQSLAVTVRLLTDENLSAKSKKHLILKEARIGIINGLILGVLSFFLIGIYITVFKKYSLFNAFSVSLCAGIALPASVFISSITGTVIPLALKKMNIDPAVASGPLITTINDLFAVISYYGLAWLLLIKIMGI